MNLLQKVLYASCLSIVLILSDYKAAIACHSSGGEITYQYNGKNYTVHYVEYASCQTCLLWSGTNKVWLNTKSASLSFNTNVGLKYDHTDTLRTGCLGDTTSCQTFGAPITGYFAHHYIDTVSFPPAPDWVISYTNCCRNYSNLLNGSSNGFYTETTLNNTLRENNSAFISGSLNAILLVNDTTVIPTWSNDADGDSITYQLIAPMYDATTSATYAGTGSISSPFGTGSFLQLNADNNAILFYSPTVGISSSAIRINEYSNGVLVSSRTREMQFTIYPSTTLGGKTRTTIPKINSGSNLSVTTCPGKTNSIAIGFSDASKTDIVNVEVIQPTIPGWTINSTVTSAAGYANVLLNWVTPSSLTSLPQFFITLRVSDNECPKNVIDYVLTVKTDSCTADSVWPGDANSDNVVNRYDPLAVAIAYNETGAARTSPTILWQPQACATWGNVFPVDNVDKKHADCNGNGTADNTDITAINNNYAASHGRTKGQPIAVAQIVNTSLFLDTSGIAFEAGKTVQIPIIFGTASSPVSDVYGLATGINIDIPTLPLPSISSTGSWLSAGSSTMVNFSKNVGTNSIDWAHARTTHTNASGFGTIGTLTINIPASTPDNTPLNISFENTRVIDSIGREIIGININGINTTVKNKLGVGKSNTIITAASIVPNPSAQKATLIVKLKTNATLRTDVTDITGRTVWTYQSNATDAIALPAQQLQSGIYFVKLTTANSETLTLKWVKE